MPAANAERMFLYFDLLRGLQVHGRLAIGIFALGLTLATAYVLRMWPIYEAQSLVHVQPAPPLLMDHGGSDGRLFDANTYESHIRQQINKVTRPDVLLGALHKLPVTAWRQSAESEQAAANRLGRAVEVTRVGTAYQVSIAARNSDPALAAQISNAVSSSFIENASRELRSGNDQHEQYQNLTMENNAPGAVYLSAAAVSPLHAVQSGVLRNALVIVVAGLLLGLLAALTAHNLNSSQLTARSLRREPSLRSQERIPASPQAAAPKRPVQAASASAGAPRSPVPPRSALAGSQPPVQEVRPIETGYTEMDDVPYSAASRLGGLRNLFTSLGLSGLDPEFNVPEPESKLRVQRLPERAVDAESYALAPAGPAKLAHPSVAAVNAPPEFLPPRAPADLGARDKEPPRPANPAPVQPDPDDVQTLPSWRGQYRRRR